MTNGLDTGTREAIRYWRKRKLDIRPWIYRIYKGASGEMLLDLNAFRSEDDPFEDVEEGYFILNTNYSNDPRDDAEMLRERKAAAFFAPWKHKIARLQRGNWVFLYRSGAGIVGYGTANGQLQKRPYQGN